MRLQFLTNCDAHLTESSFQTCSGIIISQDCTKEKRNFRIFSLFCCLYISYLPSYNVS
ncbi:hypothetical protein AALB64_03460 [Lachnospiraceae bacterium 45-P1]